MIKKLSFYKLQSNEYFTFAQRIITIISGFDVASLGLEKLHKKLLNATELLENSMTKSSTKAHTQEVQLADSLRDDAFNAFKTYLLACSKRNKPGWEISADLLIDTVRNYGWELYNDSYSTQTSKMTNLISDLNNVTALKEAANTINAIEWIEDVDAAQNLFDQKMQQRTIANSKLPNAQTDDTCKQVRIACDLLFQYINVMQAVNPNQSYLQITNQINEVISEFNSQLRSRTTRNDNARKESIN